MPSQSDSSPRGTPPRGVRLHPPEPASAPRAVPIGALRLKQVLAHRRVRGASPGRQDALRRADVIHPMHTDPEHLAIGAESSDSTWLAPGACATSAQARDGCAFFQPFLSNRLRSDHAHPP